MQANYENRLCINNFQKSDPMIYNVIRDNTT